MLSVKKYLILVAQLTIILSWTVTFGQQTIISGGTKLNNKISNFRILGKLGDKFLVERYGDNTHIVDVYNSSLKSQLSKQINLAKDEFIEKFWIQPNQGWIIRIQHEKDKNYLLASKIDNKIAIAQKALVLDSLEERKDLFEANLRSELSLNESKIMLYAPIFSQGKIDYFFTRVYDLNMRLIHQNKITDPTILHEDFEEIILLNDGSFVFITKQKEDKSVYYIAHFKTDGTVSKHQFIPVKNVFKKLAFQVDNMHHALFISGFFGQESTGKRDQNGATEFFTTKLKLSDFSNEFTEIVPFTENFYFRLTSKPSQKEQPELFTFYIHSIVPQMDGGAVVFTESYFKREEASLNNSYFSIAGAMNYDYSTVYNFNDIVNYHLDSTGRCIQQQIIRKKQISRNDGGSFSSFFVHNKQSELSTLFLDEINSDSHLSEAKVMAEDATSSRSIVNIGNKNILPIVKMSKETAPNELLIPSYNRNKMQLIKMTF
jgi:hypothetical protein